MSASKQATKRLQVEYKSMQKSPPPFVWARPNESNILEWHYILRGPPDTAFHQGEYWGVITFPPDYPFAPPGIKMNTPSGRFAPSQAICTSMSNFHPGSWNPAWSVNTILVGLLSFMLSDEITTGSIRTSDTEKKQLAAASHAWNIAQPKFKTMFAEGGYTGPNMKDLPVMGDTAPPAATSSAASSNVPSSAAPASSAASQSNGAASTVGGIDSIGPAPVAAQLEERPTGLLARWRTQLKWALLVVLLSWFSAKLLGES